ncbi:MAG: hypothetical protein VX913_02190 [Planctomycetota bacterium]|nr:hypothetical protein [Planctomycetota bacterium]
MGDFVQENKRFLVIHVAGALVFLIAWLILGAIFEGDIVSNKSRTRTAKRTASQAMPTSVNLRSIENGLKDQEDDVSALRRAIERQPKQRFTLEGQPDPDLWYNEVSERIDEELVEQCARRNIEIDGDLGRPGKYPSSPREFAWYIRGLEAVDQVLRLAIKTHDEVLEEGLARIDPITIVPPVRRRGRMASAKPFVLGHELDMTVVGHPTALAFLIEELSRAREGTALVLKEARIHSLDLPPGMQARGPRRGGRRVASDPRDRGRVEARLIVQTIDVDPKGRVKAKGAIR